MSDLQFTVTVSGMDYGKWAKDVGVPEELGSNDFADFVTQHVTGWLEDTLREYNVKVAATEAQGAQ